MRHERLSFPVKRGILCPKIKTLPYAQSDKSIKFESENQLHEMVQLIIELSNNTRLWENNGFTPNEITRGSEFDNSKSSAGQSFVRKKRKNWKK